AQMEMFANGDLTVSVTAELNEGKIHQLFEGFNSAVKNIREMMLRVSQAIESTASASAQISASTEQLAAASQEQSAQANEVATAVEEMTRTIIENAGNATRTAEVSDSNGQVAQQGGVVVQQTVEKIREIASVVGESAQTVERLGVSSEQIGEIVAVIDEIADQTNLLALNAAIEAARAGEQGRGFAVVADEVRKLAERTTSATKEIASMIKTIQTETGEAVKAMQRGNAEVEAGIVLADDAGRALEEIVTGAQSTVDMISQIAAASEEQSSTSEQISRSVEGISTVTQESAQGISQIAQSSDGLNRLTEELRQLVGRFKIYGREIGRSVITDGRGVPSQEDRPAQRPDGEPKVAGGSFQDVP
ncbi:MAG: methyl-accepting chemotaxis protein, partial [Gemmatimonadales bacterium]